MTGLGNEIKYSSKFDVLCHLYLKELRGNILIGRGHSRAKGAS